MIVSRFIEKHQWVSGERVLSMIHEKGRIKLILDG